jgi:hypothetical protein
VFFVLRDATDNFAGRVCLYLVGLSQHELIFERRSLKNQPMLAKIVEMYQSHD